MFPEVPADLSALSDEELGDLARQLEEFTAGVASGDATDEAIESAERAADEHDRVLAEQSARTAAAEEEANAAQERSERLAALAARVLPGDESDDDSGDEGNQPPDGEPALAAMAEAVAPLQPMARARRGARVAVRRGGPTRATTASAGAGRDGLPPLGNLPSQPAATLTPVAGAEVIVAGADLPNLRAGAELPDLRAVAQAVIDRRQRMVPSGNGGQGDDNGEKVVIASVLSNLPPERVLGEDPFANMGRIEAVTSPTAIRAAGGYCAPVTPYYDLMVLADAMRPVRDALAGFTADRGGIRLLPPPQFSESGAVARTVTDGVTTNGSATVTSATAAFTQNDVGAAISGTGIPASTVIAVVTNATTVTLSANATATATGVSLTITTRGATGLVTAAQDASGFGAAVNSAAALAATKPCLEVTCPSAVEYLLAAISRCLQFGNFSARAWPEQVEAWLKLALARWARTAEVALLDGIASASAQVTAARVLGTSRQLLAQVAKAASYYRNRNRMDPEAPLRVLMPAWVLDAMAVDLILGSGTEMEFFSMADQLVDDAWAQFAVNLSFYIDSGTGKSQLVNSGTRLVNGNALPTFPSTAVWYLFAEGSFLFLDGGQLDFGLIRDSALNQANKYRIFAETFESVAPVGVESLEVTSTIVTSGEASALATGPTSF